MMSSVIKLLTVIWFQKKLYKIGGTNAPPIALVNIFNAKLFFFFINYNIILIKGCTKPTLKQIHNSI